MVVVREIEAADHKAWKPLWDGYNAFYGREGPTALPDEITQTTWHRFLNAEEPVFALVATIDAKIVGIAHFLYHRNTTGLELTCYLQDLFTLPKARGQGIGRALIQAIYTRAEADGIGRVYWHTQESNKAGRLLYDKVAEHAGFIVYSHKL
ncbi:MAG: N-acetyltransferase family protein [Burkholderiaceae bacterium]